MARVAYLFSAARALGRVMAVATVHVDGWRVMSHPSHGVIVGNCGTLTMGLPLMPAVDPSDGMLADVVRLPRSTSAWARAVWAMGTRCPHSLANMPRVRGCGIENRNGTPQPVQVDGELPGLARGVRTNHSSRSGLSVPGAALQSHSKISLCDSLRPAAMTLAEGKAPWPEGASGRAEAARRRGQQPQDRRTMSSAGRS